MGAARSAFRRATMNYNLEHRVERELQKKQTSRPTVTPKLGGGHSQRSTAAAANIDFEELERQSGRNPSLESRVLQMKIEGVGVDSTGQLPGDEKTGENTMTGVANEDRPLPKRTWSPSNTRDMRELGFVDPAVVPEGKITLRQTLDLIATHKQTGTSFQDLADKYKLSSTLVEQILYTFHPFTIRTKDEFKAHLKTYEEDGSTSTVLSTSEDSNVDKSTANLSVDENSPPITRSSQ